MLNRQKGAYTRVGTDRMVAWVIPQLDQGKSGEVTVEDAKLDDYMRALMKSEQLFIEPSSCAAFEGAIQAAKSPEIRAYIEANGLSDKMKNASHIVWATGGKLVPQPVRDVFMGTHL